MRTAYTVQRTRARASRRRRGCAGQDRGGTVARSSGCSITNEAASPKRKTPALGRRLRSHQQ
ncbi:hypothetical protein XAR_3805 [Xanthomonas citri pv. glycines str. 8ra]|nr:hypothetical protein XAR_3805 [Xanthomonas citri pv. glycines str. 8ra]